MGLIWLLKWCLGFCYRVSFLGFVYRGRVVTLASPGLRPPPPKGDRLRAWYSGRVEQIDYLLESSLSAGNPARGCLPRPAATPSSGG